MEEQAMEDATNSTDTEATSPPSFIVFGRRYGATMSTAEAAGLLGCSAERLQQQRGTGTLPVEPLQLGRRLRWPTLLVAQALGVELDDRSSRVPNVRASAGTVLEASNRKRPATSCSRDRAGAA